MNETETKSSAGLDPEVTALREEIQSLRTYILSVMIVLIILSASLGGFLFKQYRMARRQTVLVWAESGANVDEFRTNTAPKAKELWLKLTEYAHTRPDINPLLMKYEKYVTVSPPAGSPPAKK